MTPTTTSSIRDWLIDCAVRWQSRNKLLVPRAGSGHDEVAAVIGPRDAALKTVLVPPAGHVLDAAPEVPAIAKAPVEQTLTVPAAEVEEAIELPVAVEPELVVEDEPVAVEPEPVVEDEPAAVEPEPVVEEPIVEEAVVEEAPVAEEVPQPEIVEAAAPAEEAQPEQPATTAVERRSTVPLAPAPAPVRPTADLSRMSEWQVLVLSGPAGSGKSSIAQQFCEILPKAVHIKIEPLRDRAYSVMVAQPSGEGSGAQPEVWTGKTEEARQQAIDLTHAYVHTGHYVIINDVIEQPSELKVYQDGLSEHVFHAVTLMPSLDELERRDKLLPPGQQAGTRIKEVQATMVRNLGAASTVLDTSTETVMETVQRIIGVLEQ